MNAKTVKLLRKFSNQHPSANFDKLKKEWYKLSQKQRSFLREQMKQFVKAIAGRKGGVKKDDRASRTSSESHS